MAYAGIIHRIATQVPTGIPTGLPADAAGSLPGLGEALTTLATQHGLLGSLLAIAISAIIAQWVSRSKAETAHAEEREDWQGQLKDLNDARLADQRELVTALQNATGVISVNSQRIAETAGSTHEIASKIAEVVLITKGNADVLKGNQEAILWLTRHRPGGVA